MKQTVIEVKDISKAYRIHRSQKKSHHPTIKDDFSRIASKPLEWVGLREKSEIDDFWALKDINFEVNKGEVLGIMGRNGSGKSTLFKILSRITQPTSGEAVITGKTASLLEVGTGFHPELTGRENVYLNGSILGMKRSEIDRLFDEIVAFSEVERFIDTPVKFYSSGMKVRLAFSVAAHLDAEILIIDEVLAVGDLRFKQKSIERMNQIAASGRTILFVSHIVRHIQRICSRGIVLKDGQIVTDEKVDGAVEKYLELLDLDESARKEAAEEDGSDMSMANEGFEIKIVGSNVELREGLPSAEIELELINKTEEDLKNLRLITRVNSQLGKGILILTNDMLGKDLAISANSSIRVKLNLPQLNLLPDVYDVNFVLRELDPKGRKFVQKMNALKLKIPKYQTGYIIQEDTELNLSNGLYIPATFEVDK